MNRTLDQLLPVIINAPADAKELELYKLVSDLANRRPCDPKTLARAARHKLDSAPEFALG